MSEEQLRAMMRIELTRIVISGVGVILLGCILFT